MAQMIANCYNRYRRMTNELNSKADPNRPMAYQIRLKGHLDREWTDWFEGLTITLEEDGNTLLTGKAIDQAALHGLFKKMRDLGMPLVSVNRVEPQLVEAPGETHYGCSKREQKMNTVNKTSRILGIAFLFQFITSFSSGTFLRQAWFVPGNIG